MQRTVGSSFTEFVQDAEPRLRRALLGAVGLDATPDAVAEALAYAWANWDRISTMDNPVGYLYRVGQTSTRSKKVPILPPPDPAVMPEVEPRLIEALDISASAVGTHVSRGIDKLRNQLEVTPNAPD